MARRDSAQLLHGLLRLFARPSGKLSHERQRIADASVSRRAAHEMDESAPTPTKGVAMTPAEIALWLLVLILLLPVGIEEITQRERRRCAKIARTHVAGGGDERCGEAIARKIEEQ